MERSELYVKYKVIESGEMKESFIQDADHESALRKFLKIKGGKEKITIIQAREWERRERRFIGDTILLSDKDSVVYKAMTE